MKRTLLAILCLVCANTITAQVAINTDASIAHGSAMLDIKSNNKGFLPPRMTWTQIQAIPNPAKGLVVFDEGLNALRVFDGKKWVALAAKKNELVGPPGYFKMETVTGQGQANCLETLISSNKTVYLAGSYYFGSITIGNTALPAPVGGNGLFVAAYDSLGNFLWAKTMNGSGEKYIGEMKFDQAGNILICGNFSGTVDLNPDAGVDSHTATGASHDAFFAKYDNNMNLIFGRHVGGVGEDSATAIISDLTGNVFVTGVFSQGVDFDPGAGVTNLFSAGATDIFIARYDASGNLGWANRIGLFQADRGVDLELLDGTLLLGGNFIGNIDCDFSAATFTLSSASGSTDVFFARYDITGSFLWAKKIGGTLRDELTDISVDASGNFWALGRFEGTADFDPDAGIVNLTASANDNTFFAKYQSTGAITFARAIVTSTFSELPSEIHGDASGNAYICGSYNGTGAQNDFEPFAPVISRNSQGGNDIFISKYDATGGLLWIADMGGAGFDVCNAFAITPDTRLIFLAGWVNSVVYFGFHGERITNSRTFSFVRYEE